MGRAARLGLPKTRIEIKSDHGATFTANLFEAFITRRKCWHTLSAVGRPKAWDGLNATIATTRNRACD